MRQGYTLGSESRQPGLSNHILSTKPCCQGRWKKCWSRDTLHRRQAQPPHGLKGECLQKP